MTSHNRPRGRGDDRRPRATSVRDVYAASADRLCAVIAMLPRRKQTKAYMGHAAVLDQFAMAVEEQVIAGQRHRQNEE